MHRSTRPRQLALLAPILCLALALPAAANAEETVTYTRETAPTYEAQLAHHEISSATFNKKIRRMHLTLTNGQHVFIHYKPKESRKLEAELKAHNVSFSSLTPTEAKAEQKKLPVHHKLRYIVGGIVIALVIVGAAVFFIRRRRMLAAE
jgi:hypothetical protein